MRLFVDQLTNLDFSYLDARRGLVGETWLANIELQGALDEQGMVCDFGEVKKTIRNWLDTYIDHRLVIPGDAKQLQLKQHNNYDALTWQCDKGTIVTTAPEQAHCIIDAEDVTPASVAHWATEQLKRFFPESVHKLTLTFSIEQINGPYYHYSHGLKKHGGNCQRIAHGHRSKIEIWENGTPSLALMQAWAKAWQDIYVGTEEDCTQDPNIADNYLFNYTAQQGAFSLSIPKQHCYLVNTDTTVELISEHIASQLKAQTPVSAFKVKAYEGIAKGAISEK